MALGAGSRGCGPGGCSEKTGSWEHLEESIPDALGVGEVDRERGSKEEAMTFGPGQDKVRVSVHADGGDGEKHFWGEGGSLGLDLLGVRYITVSICRWHVPQRSWRAGAWARKASAWLAGSCLFPGDSSKALESC